LFIKFFILIASRPFDKLRAGRHEFIEGAANEATSPDCALPPASVGWAQAGMQEAVRGGGW